MTFAAYEESRSLGEPDSIYRFTWGTNVYGYTDAEDPVTVGGVTYEPIAINRTSVNTSGSLDKSSLTVWVPEDTDIALLFIAFPPSEVVGLTIFQGHADDEHNEYLAIWSGKVLSSKMEEDGSAAMNCEPVSSSMRRSGLRIRDMYQCMHAVYGPSCKVNRDSFTTVGSVVAAANGVVTLATGWNGAINKDRFVNGIIRWTFDGRTEQRQIQQVNVATDQLRIEGILRGLVAGTIVHVSRGCNHNLNDCGEFNNVQNFGGCPWIPKKNPIGMRNEFY